MKVDLELQNLDKLKDFYPIAEKVVRKLIELEQENLAGHKDKYTHALFFKSNRPKKLFEPMLDDPEFIEKLKINLST